MTPKQRIANRIARAKRKGYLAGFMEAVEAAAVLAGNADGTVRGDKLRDYIREKLKPGKDRE